MVFQTPSSIISTAYENSLSVSSHVYACVQSEGTFGVTARHSVDLRNVKHGETYMTLTHEQAQEIIDANAFAGSTLTQVAKGYATKSKRKAAIEYITAKAVVSKRKRWTNAAKAANAGDDLRMAAYAAVGKTDRNAAWAAVSAANTDEEPKAPKSKPKASKPKSQPKADNANGLDALAEQLVALDDAAFTAFTHKLLALKTAKS